MTDAALLYYGGMFLLFFFWIYGIASFALDVKNKVVPALRRYVRARRGAGDADDGATAAAAEGDREPPTAADAEAERDRRRGLL